MEVLVEMTGGDPMESHFEGEGGVSKDQFWRQSCTGAVRDSLKEHISKSNMTIQVSRFLWLKYPSGGTGDRDFAGDLRDLEPGGGGAGGAHHWTATTKRGCR